MRESISERVYKCKITETIDMFHGKEADFSKEITTSLPCCNSTTMSKDLWICLHFKKVFVIKYPRNLIVTGQVERIFSGLKAD